MNPVLVDIPVGAPHPCSIPEHPRHSQHSKLNARELQKGDSLFHLIRIYFHFQEMQRLRYIFRVEKYLFEVYLN